LKGKNPTYFRTPFLGSNNNVSSLLGSKARSSQASDWKITPDEKVDSGKKEDVKEAVFSKKPERNPLEGGSNPGRQSMGGKRIGKEKAGTFFEGEKRSRGVTGSGQV